MKEGGRDVLVGRRREGGMYMVGGRREGGRYVLHPICLLLQYMIYSHLVPRSST